MRPEVRAEVVQVGVAALVRAVAIAAGVYVYDQAWTWIFYGRTGDASQGADIGEGLVAFGLIALVAALWAGWDRWHRTFGRVAMTWLVTGAALGVVFAVRGVVAEGGDVLVDLAALVPFIVGLVAVPAVAGAGLIDVVRR